LTLDVSQPVDGRVLTMSVLTSGRVDVHAAPRSSRRCDTSIDKDLTGFGAAPPVNGREAAVQRVASDA